MLHFAVCDDGPHMLDHLSAQVEDCLRELGCRDFRVSRFPGEQALLEAEEGFDLIFLDIQMAPPDGLETARALRRRGDGCLLVFLTVLRERVFDAFEVRAFDYLVKPADPARFRRTIERALEDLERRRARTLLVQRGTAREVIPLEELVYCEVMGRKVYLHLAGGGVVDYYDKLAELERRLGDGFFRCHRSYLVNLDQVRGCGGGVVRLRGGEAVPVSRLRERELTQALLRCMRERGG